MNDFAQDPMGGGKPLPEFVKTNLVNELSKRSNAFSFICYVNGESAALVNCFEIFSTFKIGLSGASGWRPGCMRGTAGGCRC
jgi:hypothetical protein